jgi:plastocyanin
MRKVLFSVALLLGCGALRAEEVTLPAAASIVGGAPFFSDVRAFNTSYTQSLTVTARYRCFIPQPCNPATQSVNFTLTPRESRAFNDIVVSLYNAPNTAGGIEFEHSGDSDQLVVTSRLFSTSPTPTVGMFIPGLDNSEAHATTVLTSIRNGGAGLGFRTNVGVFNREDSPVNVTFTIFDGGNQVGTPVTRSVAGHAGVQVNRIFNAAGDPNHVTDNAVVVVAASQEVFSYAAVIDNTTTDPIFIVGAEDNPPQAVTPGATATPTQPGTTTTPSRTQTPSPTRTPTPPSTTRNVSVGAGGLRYTDSVSGTSTSTITAGTTVNWSWASGFHSVSSTSSEAFESGEHSGPFSFSHKFNTPGTFTYLCSQHGAIMSGTVIVNP